MLAQLGVKNDDPRLKAGVDYLIKTQALVMEAGGAAGGSTTSMAPGRRWPA